MRGPAYTKEFYQEEVSRLTLWLTQPVSKEERVQLRHELASAREHLKDFQKQ